MANAFDRDPPISICAHIASHIDDYYVWFTGHGVDRYWVCSNCAQLYPTIGFELVPPTLSRVATLEHDGTWEGVCGSPQFKQRHKAIRFRHNLVEIPHFVGKDLIAIQPIVNSNGEWHVLLRNGQLATVNPGSGEYRILHHFRQLVFELDNETGYCMSPSADFAAIYQTSGRRA